MNIIIDDSGILLNQTKLINGVSRIEDIISILGIDYRTIKLDEKNLLFLYDLLGIRFWTLDNVLGEFQIVFSTLDKEVFPKKNYFGIAQINGKTVSSDSTYEKIEEEFETKVDDDSKQYNVNILYVLHNNVKTCSIRFNQSKSIIYLSK